MVTLEIVKEVIDCRVRILKSHLHNLYQWRIKDNQDVDELRLFLRKEAYKCSEEVESALYCINELRFRSYKDFDFDYIEFEKEIQKEEEYYLNLFYDYVDTLLESYNN